MTKWRTYWNHSRSVCIRSYGTLKATVPWETNNFDLCCKYPTHSVCSSDGIPKEEEVVLKSNQELLERYSLKEPRLIIWFTDESGRIHRPTSDVAGPAMRKFPSILYHWDIFWFLEASVDRPLTTADRIESAVRVSFGSSAFCRAEFSLDVSQHDVWMILISLNTSSSLIFQLGWYPPVIFGCNRF